MMPDVNDYFAMQAYMEGLMKRLEAYDGKFDFLLEMKARAKAGLDFSERQLAAVERSLDKWDEQKNAPAPMPVDPIIGSKVPNGTTYHALEAEDGVLKFIRLDKVEKGNWAGWVFVKHIVGPEEFRIGAQRPNGEYKGQWVEMLKRIDADPKTSIARYGKEIGSCGICHRRLTDELSREIGIGPICRDRTW